MKIADDIIAAVCAEQGISVEQLLQSGMRTKGVSTARRNAIKQLSEHHFSMRWIAGKLRISLAAVTYHVYPAARARVQRNCEKALARSRAARSEARA